MRNTCWWGDYLTLCLVQIETEMDLIGMKLNLKTTNRTRRYFGQLNGDFDGGVSMILCLTEANCLQEMGEKR